MGQTLRQCPHCRDWRSDVRRDHLGRLEPCSECARRAHEFGRCECCGYKPRSLKPPQEGGHDPLAAFERALAADFERRADQRCDRWH